MAKTPVQGFIEEGEAFLHLRAAEEEPGTARAPGGGSPSRERLDVVVIGGGQAGLSVGHYLARSDLRFVILDACDRIGDTWRKRWDSLRLFTPARYDALPGMPFPAAADSFPTKDEMADYLEAYAARFALPVRTGVRVHRLSKHDGRYVVNAGAVEFEADHVVIAMANYQHRRVPAFARELRSDLVQLHSSEYKNPSQLREGGVLVAGAGNSGAEIALELAARGHRTWLSGRDTGHIPFRIDGFLGRFLLVHLVLRFVFHRVLTVKTPIGRAARPKILGKGGALIRTKPKQLLAAGVRRAPRIKGVRDGLPLLDNGDVLDVANVVWCTGYEPGFSFIDLPIFGNDGEPLHEGGLVKNEQGLYFVGLHFLYAMSSTMIHGVGRDARRIVDTIASRAGAAEAVRERTPALLPA